MHWIDGISLDDNLISGRASGSNGENSDGNQRKSTQSSSPTKAKRRRHAHFKLNSRLDRKSSRGMIYENEELRLRTININAEVERGQSDIKRLQRENEQLRRTVWTLRDDYDRLNKRFKTIITDRECSACRVSGGSGGCNSHRCSGGGKGSVGCDGNSDDSDSCDTCRSDDGHCSGECCQEGGSCVPIKKPLPDVSTANGGAACEGTVQTGNQALHFDHLSVVSEETLSNPELLTQQNERLPICAPDINGMQSPLPSLVGPLTPLTPVELVANQLNDLQAMVPPLSYFENILSQHMGHNMALTPSPELGTNSSTTTGKTMRHTNGWDYNLRSPFSQRKYSNNSSPARSPPPLMMPPTLTTFVPTSTVPTMPRIELSSPAAAGTGAAIETVAITTNASQQSLNSPKHFFAPIKPRLKLNTKLANQGDDHEDTTPPGSPPPPLEATPIIREPPDIFVNNALASPYQRQPLQHHSPQVSPRHRQRLHCSQHHHQQQQPSLHLPQCRLHRRRCRQRPQQQQQAPQHCALHHAIVNVAAAVGLGDGGAGTNAGAASVVDIYTAALATAAAASAASKCNKSASGRLSPLPAPSPLPLSNEQPIYATAQKFCHSTCKSSTALTKPVMTITTNSTKTTTSPLRQPAKLTASVNSCKAIAATVVNMLEEVTMAKPVDNGSQTESVNLETILNDIETISEDILAIQLEKSRSRDNLIAAGNDKTKKPYRSEMNLYLQYDGTNPTISPATTAASIATITQASDTTTTNKLYRRTRSLEREHTDSPAPHMPDPMAPFPDKCSYLGFEQLNQAASKQSPVKRPQTKAPLPPTGAKPSIPAKPPPPPPPARTNLPRNNISTPTDPPPPPPGTPSIHGMSPNKSNLYKTLANAAAKRAIFRSAPTQLTRSLDVDYPPNELPCEDLDAATAVEQGDAAKRKPRRVSIVCTEEQAVPTVSVTAVSTVSTGLVTAVPTTTASCGDLSIAAASVLAHPSIKSIKQTSQSTPSSPHCSRRRTNSNTMAATHTELAATASAPPSTTHHHHRKEGSDPAPMTATVSRTRCSRRHSDGTVHRMSNASGGTHHHHHNHHHQHSSSLISSNPHHSHHSHQDSNHETVPSLSDRNSNSFASSRESSTSFSMRSNRRKISISSHTGGKIPWCGCWGNGCL